MSWESSCTHNEAWRVLDCWFDKRQDFPREGFWIHHRTSRLLVTTERCFTSRQFRLRLRIVFPVDEPCFCVLDQRDSRNTFWVIKAKFLSSRMFFISSFHLLQISRNKGFRRYFQTVAFGLRKICLMNMSISVSQRDVLKRLVSRTTLYVQIFTF